MSRWKSLGLAILSLIAASGAYAQDQIQQSMQNASSGTLPPYEEAGASLQSSVTQKGNLNQAVSIQINSVDSRVKIEQEVSLNIGLIHQENTQDVNVLLQQTGNNNDGSVYMDTGSSDSNADMFQQGETNQASSWHTASNNTYTLQLQSGAANLSLANQLNSSGYSVGFTRQQGENNSAYLFQFQSDGSATALTQIGNSNLIASTQTGSGNGLSVLQDGDYNVALAAPAEPGILSSLQQSGEANSIDMVQSGSLNEFYYRQIGQSNLFEGHQEGAGHVATALTQGSQNYLSIGQAGISQKAVINQAGSSNSILLNQMGHN